MTPEVLVLAVASALRPSTSTAAVYGLLASERPRAVLGVFTLAGILVSSAIGLVVVLALHGIDLPGSGSDRIAVVDVVAGAAMLGFAAGVWSGHVERLRRRRTTGGPGPIVRTLRRPTLRVAAVTGAATHLPGLFYLVALNAIAAGSPERVEALVEVLVYNVIWFAIPIGAFVVAGRHAKWAHATIDAINRWTREHEQAIVVVVFASAGGYLLVKGFAGLG